MTTPEQKFSQPEKSKRPAQLEISEKLNIYKRAEQDHRGEGKYIIREIKNYIEGEGEPETREQFYPGWAKEDFEKLLELIKQENE